MNDSNGWNFIEKKEECSIHIRTDPKSGFTWCRGEIIIEKERDIVKCIYYFIYCMYIIIQTKFI